MTQPGPGSSDDAAKITQKRQVHMATRLVSSCHDVADLLVAEAPEKTLQQDHRLLVAHGRVALDDRHTSLMKLRYKW